MDRNSCILLEKIGEELGAIPNFSSVFVSKVLEHFGKFGDRCVIFRIFLKVDWMCKIVGGVPQGHHNVGLIDPLIFHPDIDDIVLGKEVISIKNPRESDLTAYFREIIFRQNIKEILYVPILLDGLNAEWVIVVDACGERVFSLSDIEFFGRLEELFSFLLWREKNPEGRWSTFEIRRIAAKKARLEFV